MTDYGSREEHKYDDIIFRQHHTSLKRPPMSMLERAAQFSPFAALTGYEEAVKETARLTEKKAELEEYEKEVLDEKMKILQKNIKDLPKIEITFFQPDDRKEGGASVVISGKVKKINNYQRFLVMAEGQKIPMDDIMEMEGEIFRR